MALKKFDAFVQEGQGHEVEVYGQKYVIPHAPADPVLKFSRLLALAAKAKKAQDAGEEYDPTPDERDLLEDADEETYYRDALSDEIYDRMIDDGVPFEGLKMVATYVLMYAAKDAETADAWLAAGGKAPAPNRKARRTATRTRTGAAGTTKRPASRSGTSTRKGATRPAE